MVSGQEYGLYTVPSVLGHVKVSFVPRVHVLNAISSLVQSCLITSKNFCSLVLP